MDATAPGVVGPRDGTAGFLGSIGVRFLIDGADSGGGFPLVEYPMSPRALGAPLHRHTHERYFAELVALGGSRAAPPDALRALSQRYSLEVDFQSIPGLLERFRLRIGEPL